MATYKTDKQAYVEALRFLHRRVPELYARLRALLWTDKRTAFDRTPEGLFLASPHLADKQANWIQIAPGWFADTNINNATKQHILIVACEIAGVSYPYELEIEFAVGHRQALSRADMDAAWDELSAL